MPLLEFSLNDLVWIQLNDKGRRIHRAWYAGLGLEYIPAEEDHEGWSEWQAWNVMQVFGPHVRMGPAPPFSLGFRIDANNLTEVER